MCRGNPSVNRGRSSSHAHDDNEVSMNKRPADPMLEDSEQQGLQDAEPVMASRYCCCVFARCLFAHQNLWQAGIVAACWHDVTLLTRIHGKQVLLLCLCMMFVRSPEPVASRHCCCVFARRFFAHQNLWQA